MRTKYYISPVPHDFQLQTKVLFLHYDVLYDFKKWSEEKSSFPVKFWIEQRLNSKSKQNVSCVQWEQSQKSFAPPETMPKVPNS